MASKEQIKQELLDYMNEHCVDDPPYEDILPGHVMQNPENIAYVEKKNRAYRLADELLTPDGQALWFDDEKRIYSIGPDEE